ncbi:MAG: type II secretion system protein [Opitutales bacterium]|nr:type II secretion system protein [Opitutales bacterium]
MKRGFTLIEVIASLVLLGIVSAIVGLMLGTSVQRYGLERNAAADNQKADIALSRIVKELTSANWSSIQITDEDRRIEWVSIHPGRIASGVNSLSWQGEPGGDLRLNGYTLIDRVRFFAVSETTTSDSIEVKLQTGTTMNTLHTRIYPR